MVHIQIKAKTVDIRIWIEKALSFQALIEEILVTKTMIMVVKDLVMTALMAKEEALNYQIPEEALTIIQITTLHGRDQRISTALVHEKVLALMIHMDQIKEIWMVLIPKVVSQDFQEMKMVILWTYTV